MGVRRAMASSAASRVSTRASLLTVSWSRLLWASWMRCSVGWAGAGLRCMATAAASSWRTMVGSGMLSLGPVLPRV